MNGSSGPSSAAPRALGIALIGYLAQGWLYRHYLTDDTFIYARFAANLADHGQLAFNPGSPVHAATSPLWAALGAAGAFLGASPFWTLKVLGGVAGALTIVLFFRTVSRLLPSPWPLWATLVLATEPWFVRWAWSGMETALGSLLVVGVAWAGLRARPRWGWLGWLLGLGPLVRPELILLLGLVGVFALRRGAGPGFWWGLTAPMVVWSAVALSAFGHVFPATLDAKSTPFGLVGGRALANAGVLAQLVGGAVALPALVWVASLRPARFWRPGASGSPVEPALWTWIVLLPVVYVIRDVQVVSRYLEVILPLVILLASMSVATWPGRRLWVAAWCLQVALGLGWTMFRVVPSTRAFSQSIDVALGDIARWLRDETDADDVVAIYDIGIVGYRSERPILDLGGLVHPGINRLRNRYDDETIVRDGLFFQVGDPAYLVHRDRDANALVAVRPGGRGLTPVLSRRVANLGVSRAEPVVYTLYRVAPP